MNNFQKSVEDIKTKRINFINNFTPEQDIPLHEDLGLKKSIETNFKSNNRNVDINKLLNRVKINK